jgi:predicted extracellular nuclease
MKKPVSINSPGQMTVLAALLAGLCAPAFASDVVISQVYGGGGNGGATYTNDFIELFNSGASAVNLAGMSVQYAAAGGNTWQVTNLPAFSLQPGQYFLVSENSNAAVGNPLPAADASANIMMAGGAGKVLLSSVTTAATGIAPTANVLDMVGYGSITGGTENPSTGTLSATKSARRKLSCTDTNNNGADFDVVLPTPRNTATALAPCGGTTTYPIVASCPTPLSLAFGSGGSVGLSAIDFDDAVSGASITSSPVAGLTLGAFAPGGAANTASSVPLNVSASVAVGNYAVAIRFTNARAEQASCTVNVAIQGESGVTFTIPEIQGAGATSPHQGVQTTEGVITAKVGTGFFMQDERSNGDNDPTTSDAIFVYTGTTPVNAAVGDLVRVTATVTEYTPTGATRSYTEMTGATSITVKGTGRSITPANIDLAGTNLAQYEGMLVRFATALTVSQSEFLGPRGELTLSSGRLEVPTNKYRPRTPEAVAMAAANAANMIVLDDGIFVTPVTIPYIGEGGTIRAGDTVSGLTGVIDFGAIGGGGAAFKLQPTIAPVFSRDNPRPAGPSFAEGNVKVASANVLNFFTTFTNGSDVTGATGQGCTVGTSTTKSNCRGADNINEFTRQRDKIVNALKLIDADVFGLMEIQNSGEYTVTYLVDALNAAIGGAPLYAVVPKPATTGTDAIRVAMIYKPSKLTLVGGASLSDGASVFQRPPMAATFKAANGGKFSLIVNHFKSKGSCPAGTGVESDKDGQGCWNDTRTRQAKQLRDGFIPAVITAAGGDGDVLVIGDLNAHGFEDPINLLTDAGMVNQLERYVRGSGATPYSFIFDGASGYLDHALATPGMSPQVSGASEFHNNADEPTVIDYNTDGKPQDLYTDSPYRASDHDPVIISLNLAPTWIDSSASFNILRNGLAVNRTTGKYTGTLSFTNKTAAPISGPFQVLFSGLSAGVTLDNKSGDQGGYPYLTANGGTIAPGATITVSITFSNPNKVAVGYTPKIITGSF